MENYSLKAKHLYRFLYKKNLIRKFLKNAIQQHPYDRGVPQYLDDKDFLKLLDILNNIDFSFIWSRTEEGHTFWYALNEEELRDYRRISRDIATMQAVKKS